MCMLVHKDVNKLSLTLAVKGVILCVLIYFVYWIAYYTGVTNAVVILGLTLPPCIVFVLYGTVKRERIQCRLFIEKNDMFPLTTVGIKVSVD